MHLFRFVLLLALSVVGFSLTADAKPKRCSKHPYISYFPTYETTYDHSNGSYQRSKYDLRKKPRRYDECWEPLKSLLHIHKTSDHQIQNLTYFSYGETCAANAIGYLKIYGTDRFFSNGTSTFAKKFFGDEEFFDGISRNMLDTTKDICGRYPDTLKLLIAFDALYDNEPELARTQKYHWPYWKQGYEGDFYIRQDGTYKIVDVDPKLRRWANRDRRNDWHERQIERFDRVDTVESAFADLAVADQSGRGFLGIQIEEFAPEVTWQKLAFRKELGPSIRIVAVDPAGPMCLAGFSSGDVINSIRSYVPNKGMIKVGSYWTSYTLDATVLPSLLLDLKADQPLLVDWMQVSTQRYRRSVVRTVSASQNQEYANGNSCKLPNDRLEALFNAADDFHFQALKGDLSTNTRIFIEAEALARRSIAALNQQKGSADITFESVLTRSNIDRMPSQWCCQSNANQSPASRGVGALIQPEVGAILRGRRFSSI